MRTPLQPHGYAALISAIVLGAFMLMTVASILVISLSDLRIAQNSIQGNKAFHVAEAGMEHLLSNWLIHPLPQTGMIFDHLTLKTEEGGDLGTYTVTVADLGNGLYRMGSTGRSRNTARKIEADVSVGIGGISAAFENALMTNSPIKLPSNMNIWGDVYLREGLSETWENGKQYSTDGLGTKFAYLPTTEEAPYGTFRYYFSSDDTWQIIPSPQATSNGDAHGFWLSSQKVNRKTTWLNPIHNIGDPGVPNSGQYYNRNVSGEFLDPAVTPFYNTRSGIAVRNDAYAVHFPGVEQGLYANFVGAYESAMSNANERKNLRIQDLSKGGTISLANGKNNAIIGSEANRNGFPTQFAWSGNATRDDGSTYTGGLAFDALTALYVDGPITITGNIAMDVLTLISSDQATIGNLAQYPTNHFDVLAFGDIIIQETQPLAGVLFTSGTLKYQSAADFTGTIVAQDAEFQQGIDLVYDRSKPFAIRSFLPNGSQQFIAVQRWKEIAP